MRDGENDTPPSSLDGDEIKEMVEEMDMFEEIEEIFVDGDDSMDSYTDETPEDDAILVFDKHRGSVFCCDLHPDGKLAVTGGEDDKAYVWSVDTGKVIMACVGHKDSIVFVGFSFDGAYLATADMAGMITVWKVNTEENQEEPWPVTFEYEADDISWAQWHFGTRVLICGFESGDIFVFKIPSGDTKVIKGHNSKVECGKLFSDGVRLAAGYEDGSVKIWDLKAGVCIGQLPSSEHGIRVTAVDTHPEGNLLASISTDGKVILTTSNNSKIIGQLEGDTDLETVAFSLDPVGYLGLGTLKGGISMWDVPRQMLRHKCETGNDTAGVTKMIWIKNHLLSALLDGSIKIYECPSGKEVGSITGHKSAILDLCYNAKRNIILTTADDDTARIYKYVYNQNSGTT